MGAWTTVLPEIESVMADMGMKQQRLRYAGRPAAASPATGLLRRHLKEQAALVEDALVVETPAQRAAQ
jgi:2-oxoglutarate dehydrogenase E1 component